jgi:hypothetical protein
VPGEHDLVDEDNGKAYLDRFGKNTKGSGWYSFDAGGVHFIGLVNVTNLKAGGMGSLGEEQLAWLTDDLKGKPTSTPVVVFAHIPLWTVSADWGWGTEDSARGLALLTRFGSVTVLNGHIHQLMQKVEGHVTFHTAMSTAFPQPAPEPLLPPDPCSCQPKSCAVCWASRASKSGTAKAPSRSPIRRLPPAAETVERKETQHGEISHAEPRPCIFNRSNSRRRSGIARSGGGHGGDHR